MIKNQLRKFVNSKLSVPTVLKQLGIQYSNGGDEYKVLCPFHADKNPSCFINSNKKLFHCFACQKSGDLIYFIAHIKKIPVDSVIEEYSALHEFPKTLKEYEEYIKVIEDPIDPDKQYIDDLQFLLEVKYSVLKIYYDKMKVLEIFSEYEIKYHRLETEIFNIESELECCLANYFEKTHPPKIAACH